MPQFNRNVYFRKGLRGPGWCTPEYFGAKGSYSVDDSAAFQAANDAMAQENGGKVYLAGRQYRTDSQINLDPCVSWEGVTDATFWSNNHATRIHHQWGAGTSRVRQTLMENIIFGGIIGNTGNVINITHAINVRYKNCAFNAVSYEDNLQGKILSSTTTPFGGEIAFENCYLRAVGDASVLYSAANNSKLRLEGNTFVMPSSFTRNLVENVDGVVEAYGNYFDATAHGGGADVISLLNNLDYHIFKGNKFKSAFSAGVCFRTAISGIKLSETGSVFDTINAYGISGTLALGSELTLSNPIQTSTSATSINCATGYRGQRFRLTGTAPTITLPTPLFYGQEFDLIVYNDSGSSWAGIAIVGGDPGAGIGTTASGTARTMKWKAADAKNTGTLRWIMHGDVSQAITL